MPLVVLIITSLFNQFQFIDKVFGAAQFVDAPQNIPDVDTDGPVQILIKSDLMTQGFIIAVKSQSDQIS